MPGRLKQPALDPALFFCRRCGRGVAEQFMVNDDLWRHAQQVLDGREVDMETDAHLAGGVLHLECLEALIGRQVCLRDLEPYTAAPINRVLRMGMKRSGPSVD